MTHFTHTKGYSLVEVLVAVAVLMLAIVGPMTIAAKSYQSAQYTHQQNTAFFLAQEGISAVNVLRNDAALDFILNDSNNPWDWVDGDCDSVCHNSLSWMEGSVLDPCFINDSDAGCNIDFRDATLLNNITDCGTQSCVLLYDEDADRAIYQMEDGEESPYTRIITLHPITNDEILVTATVTWQSTLLGPNQSVSLSTSLFNFYK